MSRPEPTREQSRTGGGFTYTAATLITLALVVVGFLSVLWTPFPSMDFDVGSALQDPSGMHWLGTDPLGRDLLSLVMKSLLTSFVVAGIAVIIGALIGIPLGLLAARWWRAGEVGSSLATLLALFPPLIVATILATDFGASAVVSMVAIGIGAIVPLARVTAASVRSFSSMTYLDAAQLAGLTRTEAIGRSFWRST